MDNKGYIIIWDWRFFVIVGIIILIFWVYPTNGDSSTEDWEDDESLEEKAIPKKKRPPIDPRAYYWGELPIHYYFSEDYLCNDIRKSKVIKSFNIIEEKTDKVVTFYEGESEYAIEIICYDEYISEEVAAYGGIEFYEGEKEILSGSIELYQLDPINFEVCESYPSTILHEILHAIGFDHIDSKKSIMNSIGDGCIKLDSEIVDCLKHIYLNDQGNYTCEGVSFME